MLLIDNGHTPSVPCKHKYTLAEKTAITAKAV